MAELLVGCSERGVCVCVCMPFKKLLNLAASGGEGNVQLPAGIS